MSPAGAETVLGRILASTRIEVERRKREVPDPARGALAGSVGDFATSTGEPTSTGEQFQKEGGLRARARPRVRARAAPLDFYAALTRPGIAVISEFKRRSPSAGALRGESPDLEQLVSAYERGGASALSVLTEGPHFDGSLDDVRAARSVCELPILRKDFIIDPYQLHEALAAGADAVLLIVAALERDELGSLHEQAHALGLGVLVEVHDSAELHTALDVGARLIGVNNRDLRDFSVDVERTLRLMPAIPQDIVVVSESGIVGPEQLRALHAVGVQAVLVGETLMRAPDPELALRTLLGSDTFTQSDD